MEKTEIPYLSATEISRLIASREVSPVEATEAYLERIDALDFKFNAYLTVCREGALRAAREAEQAVLRGNRLGPMHGIPVAVKDQLWTAGVRTTGGTPIMADFLPTEDATVVANLKRAGAILLGKTNLTEFALAPSIRYSHPRNPWDLDMSTGPSSGGSGAATAAYLCSTSLGEDTSGSIRFPSAWCGVVGLKPSWGRVSRHGIMRGVWSMDAAGPMARTVADAAMTLEAIAGYDPKDPYSWDTPVPGYVQDLHADIRGVKIGMVSELTDSGLVDPEVRAAIVEATSVLQGLGATVEEVSIPMTGHAFTLSWLYVFAEAAITHKPQLRSRARDYGRANRVGLLTGSIVPTQAYHKALKLRGLLRQQVEGALQTYDVLLSPTLGRCAQPVQEDRPMASAEEALPLPYILTATFSLTGGPAVSVPCGLNSQRLPIGLQIAAGPGADSLVLKVAHAYEQATPWHAIRPPNA